jgi:hypothetical protein
MDVELDDIEWEEVSKTHATFTDNGSPLLDQHGRPIQLTICPVCNKRGYNHTCALECSHPGCSHVNDLFKCKKCQVRLVCEDHNQGEDNYILCEPCLQQNVRCVACDKPLPKYEKRRGKLRHMTCPITHVNKRKPVFFEFKQSPFCIYWNLDPKNRKFNTMDFTDTFTTLYNKYAYYGDATEVGRQVIEMLMSWRTAILALYRRFDNTLKCKTSESLNTIFNKSDDDTVKSFIAEFVPRIYECDVDYRDMVQKYGLDKAAIDRFIFRMGDMLLFFRDYRRELNREGDKKTEKARYGRNLEDIPKITEFTKQILQLNPEARPKVVSSIPPPDRDVDLLAKSFEKGLSLLDEEPVPNVIVRRRDRKLGKLKVIFNDGNGRGGTSLSVKNLHLIYNKLFKRAKKGFNPLSKLLQTAKMTKDFEKIFYANICKLFAWNPHIERFNIEDMTVQYHNGQTGQLQQHPMEYARLLFFHDLQHQHHIEDLHSKEWYQLIYDELKATESNWSQVPFYQKLFKRLQKMLYQNKFEKWEDKVFKMIKRGIK